MTYLEANRAYWDELTGVHVGSDFYKTAAFLRGEDILDPVAAEAVGPVAGLRLLHLQCHFGLDTLSLARRGADVTGLDFSSAALAAAQELAEKAGLEARFVEANVLDPPADLSGFDVVFASWGAICWIPDMAGWMTTAARALKPGGRLHLIEGHPAMLMLDERQDGEAFTVRYPWDSATPLDQENQGDYASDAVLTAHRNVMWFHGLERILSSAMVAGLTVRGFRELDRIPWRGLPQLTKVDEHYWMLPDDAPQIPLGFALTATRE